MYAKEAKIFERQNNGRQNNYSKMPALPQVRDLKAFKLSCEKYLFDALCRHALFSFLF
jgi:hypothetical protein